MMLSSNTFGSNARMCSTKQRTPAGCARWPLWRRLPPATSKLAVGTNTARPIVLWRTVGMHGAFLRVLRLPIKLRRRGAPSSSVKPPMLE